MKRPHKILISHAMNGIAVATAAVLLVSPSPSIAGFFVGPAAGSVAGITYNVENVNPAGGAIYGPSGDLQNVAGLPGAGAGYGSVGAPVAAVGGPGGGISAPAAPLGTFGAFHPAVPAAGFGDTFGGSAKLRAISFGPEAGIFWTNPTFIYDSGPNGRASDNFSRGVATFTDNVGGLSTPYVALAIRGSLGNQGLDGAFVAASLLGNFSIFDALGNLVNSLSASVAVVSDGPGPRNDFVTNIPSGGADVFYGGIFGAGLNSFEAYGVDILPAAAIPVGGTVRLDGTLSFIADPNSYLTLDVIPLNVPLGDFGFLAANSIPEPSSIGLLAIAGLVFTAVWRRRQN